MGWDVVIFGELELAAAKQKKWLEARAIVGKATWPQILAPDDDVIDSDRGSVADLLEQLRALGGGPTFFELVRKGSTVTIRAFLDEDTYREVQDDLVAVLSAASKAGATGRLDVRNAAALTGGAIELGAKGIRELAGKLTSEDKRRAEEILRRVAAPARPAARATPGDPAIARLQALATRTASQERELHDRLQLAMIRENRAGKSPADVKDAIKRVEARMKARAKRR